MASRTIDGSTSMDDLKFGDIVEWLGPDKLLVRWMIVTQHPKYQTEYEAAWMTSRGDNPTGYKLGDVKRIGTHETNKVTRG
jgi:hypothetical protein